MNIFRKLLLPFSLIYWVITGVRNFLFDRGIYKSTSFNVPVIAIGNLSTGGTGKSPQTEYLIRLLSSKYRMATLSRGYKRKSEGFILADASSNAQILGDEPFQFFRKFPNISVAVDANRKNGIEQLLSLNPKPQVILLDDAYQHRKVKAGFYILLTAYGDIYADDYILPAGNLRESRSGANRANVIVVTKCPPDISVAEQQKIIKKLKPLQHQQVYFTCIIYDDKVYNENGNIDVAALKGKTKVLVAGIAKPKPFFDYLKEQDDVVLSYPDHHDFSEKEIAELNALSKDKIIIATEKDYVRLNGQLPQGRLYYLPIRTSFITDVANFDTTVLDYVSQNI